MALFHAGKGEGGGGVVYHENGKIDPIATPLELRFYQKGEREDQNPK